MKKIRILFIGDSIRMGYVDFVEKKLKDRAEILKITENCEDSNKVKNNIDKWINHFGKTPIDIIQLNCGLHDIKKEFGSDVNQVPIANYKINLKFIIKYIKENTNSKIIWANTTPVITELHHKNKPFDRDLNDVIKYNQAAAEIMVQNTITIINLFQLTENTNLIRYMKKDGVHFKRKGYKKLANIIIEKYEEF